MPKQQQLNREKMTIPAKIGCARRNEFSMVTGVFLQTAGKSWNQQATNGVNLEFHMSHENPFWVPFFRICSLEWTVRGHSPVRLNISEGSRWSPLPAPPCVPPTAQAPSLLDVSTWWCRGLAKLLFNSKNKSVGKLTNGKWCGYSRNKASPKAPWIGCINHSQSWVVYGFVVPTLHLYNIGHRLHRPLLRGHHLDCAGSIVASFRGVYFARLTKATKWICVVIN